MMDDRASSLYDSIVTDSWLTHLERNTYLDKLRPLYHDCDLVKVLTGVRRCGKSVLLRQVAEDLRRTVPADRVIEANFELASLASVQTWEDLDRLMTSKIDDASAVYYVLLDEVQEIEHFEKAVNSLRARGNISVFITGSNAHILSGELSTYLAGRYREIRVWPLNYAETLALQRLNGLSVDNALQDYLQWGGMPHRFRLVDDDMRGYLRDVFNSVVLRDVVKRTGIRDIAGLESIIDFTLENLGRVMSPASLSNYLKAQRRTVAVETIYTYLRALCDALLLNRVRRYDVRGKKVMASLDKYYATDVGILASKQVGSGPGLGDLIENTVYTQLAARGFDVYAGETKAGEIDFVAVKDEPRYIQVTYLLASDEVVRREYSAFAALRDGYPRFLISADPLTSNRDGVTHLKLEDFLLNPPEALQ